MKEFGEAKQRSLIEKMKTKKEQLTTPYAIEFDHETFGKVPHIDPDTQTMNIVLTCDEWLHKIFDASGTHFGGLICMDAKHKVTWNKIPVIPVCVIDADGHGHFVGIALSTSEAQGPVRTIAESIINKAGDRWPAFVEHYKGEIRYGKSDGADAYGNMGNKCEHIREWGNCFMHLIVCNLTKNGGGLNKAIGKR